MNILIGPNGSGKSSILDVILKLIQYAKYPEGSKTTLVRFVDTEFHHYNKIVHKNEKGAPLFFNISLKITPPLLDTIWHEAKRHLAIDQSYFFRTSDMKDLLYQVRIVDGRPEHHAFLLGNNPILSGRFLYRPFSPDQPPKIEDGPEMVRKLPINLASENLFFEGVHLSKDRDQISEDQIGNCMLLLAVRRAFKTQLSFVNYISAVRQPMKWEAQLDGQDPENVGLQGEKSLQVLQYLVNKEKHSITLDLIVKWAEAFGYSDISSFVHSVNNKANTSTEVLENDLRIKVNLASTGFGFQQLIPIIIQSFYTPGGGTFIIEEPEIHLHPANQVKLIDLFIEAIKSDVQIIFSTHSEHLFLRLQRRIADGTINPSDVGIFYVNKTNQGTTVQELSIKESGSIPGWLPSFFEVAENEIASFYQLRAKKENQDESDAD